MEYAGFGIFGVLGTCGFYCCRMMMHNRDYEKRMRQEQQKSDSNANEIADNKLPNSSNGSIAELNGTNQFPQTQQPLSVISDNQGVHSTNSDFQIPNGEDDPPPCYSEVPN